MTDTTKKDMMRTPQKQIITPTIRPKNVLGKRSPYPAEVSVMIMFHIELLKLRKFCPEASLIGPSNILSWKARIRIEIPKLPSKIVYGFYFISPLRANREFEVQPLIAQTL